MINIPFKVTKHLSIAEEFGEIDMENMASSFHHDVIIVSVTNTEYVSRYAIPGAGKSKVLYRLLKAEHRRSITRGE
jgi:hypothetical protein